MASKVSTKDALKNIRKAERRAKAAEDKVYKTEVENARLKEDLEQAQKTIRALSNGLAVMLATADQTMWSLNERAK